MANYIFTNKAVEDLSEIWDYTFEVWSEAQADKYYRLLLDACRDLADSHSSGKSYPEISETLLGYRIGQHIIFYRAHTKSKIEVVRILHARMDLTRRTEE